MISAKIDQRLIITGAVTLVVLYWLVKQEAKQAVTSAKETVQDAAQAINPVNPENIFSAGATAIGNAVANDSKDLPLGVRIYDWFHPGQ